MKRVQSLEGQILALSNLAKSYESMLNLTKACEALDKVSRMTTELEQMLVIYPSSLSIETSWEVFSSL